MPEVEHDLGPAAVLEAEAIGQPGQRTFRLRARTTTATVSLRMEKEQVHALATAIDRVLAQHRGSEPTRRKPRPRPLVPFPETPTFDFHVSRLALGYDEGADRLAIYATDVESPHQEHPTLRVTFTRTQARLFTVQADATVAAGRPQCPLCEAPLEGLSHFCPPTNGHSDDALAWLSDQDG